MSQIPQAPTDPLAGPKTGKLHRFVWPWLIGGGTVLALLTLWLGNTVHPWHVVLTIPSGYDEADYTGVSQGGPSEKSLADLSPDERLLAILRPNSTVELWDLQDLKKKISFAAPFPPDYDDHPALSGGHFLRFFAGGQRLLYIHDDRWKVYDVAAKRDVFELDHEIYHRLAVPSPDGQHIAALSIDVAQVYRVGEAEPVMTYARERVNGGSARIQWSPDGRSLLINDYLSVRVIDALSGEERFAHRELDLSLPPPMIADDQTGLNRPEPAESSDATDEDPRMLFEARDKKYDGVAMLVDSQFSADGTVVASAYQPEGLFGNNRPDANRVRFYFAANGRLLADHIVGNFIRNMRMSPDGSRLYVLTTHDFEHHLFIFDTARRELIDTLKYKLAHHYPGGVEPFTDNRTVASHADQLWLIDTTKELASVQLQGSPNPDQLLVNEAGDQIVEVGMDKTVRVWRQLREATPMGAYAMPATWAIHTVAMAAMLGMVLTTGRKTQREIGRPLPKRLWAAMLVIAVGFAIAIADNLIGYAVDHFYVEDRDLDAMRAPIAVTIFGTLLGLYWTVGLLRLRNGWRKLTNFCYWAGVVTSTLLIIMLLARFETNVIERVLDRTHTHGLRYDRSVNELLALTAAELVLFVFQLFCLRSRPVRELFTPQQSVPSTTA